MEAYILIMILATGEIVHSDVPPTACREYAENIRQGHMPVVGEGTEASPVVTALCGPRKDLEPAGIETGSIRK